jgi:FAD-dependent urate hydroxylase
MSKRKTAIDHAARMPQLPELTTRADFTQPGAAPLPETLEQLELLIRRDLDLTKYPAKSWVIPRTAPDGSTALDVLIVGGGQAGLATAFALQQQRVTNILVIDENPEGAEGPWGTYARMETLRTQKDVGGIEFGIPNLSLRAWYEVQHGIGSWGTLYKIGTDLWHRYLAWYRRILGLPVANNCRMVGFDPNEAGDLVRVDALKDGQPVTFWAQTVILATGIEGNGIRNIPPVVADNLPRSIWAHSHEAIDFAALAGKRVAALGGGASAYDNAILAAEHGAASVHLYHRAKLLRPANPMAWGEFNGYLAHFADLEIADRWRFTRGMRRFRGGPPLRTMARAKKLSNLIIHPGTTWDTARMDGDHAVIGTSEGQIEADFVILGTGYRMDMKVKPEFARHLPLIRLWGDTFTPPPGEEDKGLLGAPLLGAHFEFLEKVPGTAPWLKMVFNFSRGANLSMGPMSAGLSGIKFGVPRLVEGVTRRLFVANAGDYYEGMKLWQESDDIYEP